MNPTGGIVLLAQDGPSTRAIYHVLISRFENVTVVLEKPPSRARLLLRRRHRIGTLAIIGQVLFMVAVVPVLARKCRTRVAEIVAGSNLVTAPIPDPVELDSVNSDEARLLLQGLSPDVVVISGTRIISAATITSVPAPFINMHAGITPSFRGVHGGYWALCEARPDLVGTTVHLVDEGIDTGQILCQKTFSIDDRRDSFVTYPYHHTAAGLQCLIEVVERAKHGSTPTVPSISDLPSRLWSHPTLWGYLSRRIRAGVR
jgi:folate-dependent phosphoribosylglycinamide formyltransferase PurN